MIGLRSAFLTLSADQWSAAGQIVLALGAVSTAAWAAYTFRMSKRAEAARWMVALFRDFYRDETMSRARELIEYDFDQIAGPLLELRVLDRHIPLSQKERDQLRDLDLVLNFLEQLLYLQAEGHLLDRDKNVFFEYWFDQLAQPDHSGLRRYLRNCGYERCSHFLDLEKGELLVAYGSLLTGHGDDLEARIRSQMRSLGPCIIKGQLFSRGEFPALIPGPGHVEGELFYVDKEATFRDIDQLEHYDPRDRAASLYRRRCVRTLDPAVDAWVYYWNRPVDNLEQITTGSWTQHKQSH